MLRLCALVPYNVFNYAISITAVSIRDYTLGGIGMVPLLMAYVFAGTTVGSLTEAMDSNEMMTMGMMEEDESSRTVFIIALIAGCVVLVGIIVWITIVVK